jgi:hypothetical protein
VKPVWSIFAILLPILASGWLRAQTAPSSDTSNKSWTSTSTVRDPAGTANPLRVTESHTESGGRIIDNRKLERLGSGGQYVPYLEIESETVRVNSTTVKTVERSYGTNPDGGRVLVQETREEQQKFGGGAEKVVRSTSSPDANGNLHTVQQEVRESKSAGTGVRQTDSTILLPDVNGNLSPSRKTQVVESKKSDQLTEYKQSVSLPDANGSWRVSEVREGKITGSDAQNRVREENVIHPDLDGHLTVDQRTVTKDEKPAGGEKRQTVDTYSTYSPGSSPDGMQLNERVVTVDKTNSGGSRSSVRQVQERDPGDSRAGVRPTSETIDIVRPGLGGTSHQEQTVRLVGADGKLNTVWVDMGKLQDTTPLIVDTKTSATKSASGAKATKPSNTPSGAASSQK